MSIAFHDEHGVRWTVAVHPTAGSDEPRNSTLFFTSEAGERRTCAGWLPEGGTWDDVGERVWCALLHHAEVVSKPATGA